MAEINLICKGCETDKDSSRFSPRKKNSKGEVVDWLEFCKDCRNEANQMSVTPLELRDYKIENGIPLGKKIASTKYSYITQNQKEKAIELRGKGLNYREIGASVGISQVSARKIVLNG